MEFLTQYGLFVAKAITIVVAILITAGGVIALAMRHKKTSEKKLEVTHLNKIYEEMEHNISVSALSRSAFKRYVKSEKKKHKEQEKHDKKADKKNASEAVKRKLFVIDFDGDIKASNVENLREEISAILTIADKDDEVLVKLESGGGSVHGYGLGASQLQRIRDHGVPLTVSVDKVAASGGYMMACVGSQIISAPFAIIGSIGVLAQIPNLHRLLKKNEIDFEQLYAGEYKRTLTLFGENTDKGRAKVQQELEETHQMFKDFVKSQRPEMDIDSVATGEYWLGTRAMELGLVDKLQTSDDYVMDQRQHRELIKIEYTKKPNLMDKLSAMMSLGTRNSFKELQHVDKPLLM